MVLLCCDTNLISGFSSKNQAFMLRVVFALGLTAVGKLNHSTCLALTEGVVPKYCIELIASPGAPLLLPWLMPEPACLTSPSQH